MLPVLLTQTIVLFQDTSLVYVLSIPDFPGCGEQGRGRRDGRAGRDVTCSRPLVYFHHLLRRLLWRAGACQTRIAFVQLAGGL